MKRYFVLGMFLLLAASASVHASSVSGHSSQKLNESNSRRISTTYHVSAVINAELDGFRIDFVNRAIRYNGFCVLNVIAWTQADNRLNIEIEVDQDNCLAGTGHDYGWKWFSSEDVWNGEYELYLNGERHGRLFVQDEFVGIRN